MAQMFFLKETSEAAIAIPAVIRFRKLNSGIKMQPQVSVFQDRTTTETGYHQHALALSH
jgi:hypothetical protein